MRLSAATLPNLPDQVTHFGYDRDAQAVGIVHLGIGAFHRAHQAWYTDRAMAAGDRDWAITGVSLRSASVAQQLNPQDGLYSVNEKSATGAHSRVIGAVRGVIVASEDREGVIAAIAAPATRIVSFTVTEKGYCRAAEGGIDFALAEAGFYPLLAEAFKRRQAAGNGGLTLLSCDNLSHNGAQLQRLVEQYLAAQAPEVATWFAATCTCPSSMVDRIVPATTPEDQADVAARLGADDAGAVMTEPFSQWVIEDRFAAGRPAWEGVGAQMVADVAPYETAKLRMLNGAHSALAYIGLERGHRLVSEAIRDPELRDSIRSLMLEEAAPSFTPADGQDLAAYAADLLHRFENPALQHRLIQIAMDGSQKIPQRWLETAASRRAAGAECPVILQAAAAWLRHARGDNGPVDDPQADRLAELWQEHGKDGIVDAVFGDAGLLGPALPPEDRAKVQTLL